MARSWTCTRCGMTTSFQAGAKTPQKPHGWSKEKDGWRCLRCRREEVVEEISEQGGDKAAQRRALIEFELIREPEANDRDIARRAGCQAPLVGPVRKELLKKGRLPAAS
jgi:hypothetical protein